MRFLFIRHGKTKGNLEGRYVGRTDEGLCMEGMYALKRHNYRQPDILFSSPMRRCLETCQILFPVMHPICIEELKERDFGAFEYHDYKELSADKRYQEWIDSNGTLPFPEGEADADFRKRSISAFDKIRYSCDKEQVANVAIIAHGGTIMSILSEYGTKERSFYDWYLENGDAFLMEWSHGLHLI